MALAFSLIGRDAGSGARRGRLHTAHGVVETPAFMPVGTRATVTGLLPADLRAAGAPILLANTYHLLLRPGAELFRRVGGIHAFMRWDGPVLTDSGGYQIFSLPADRDITEAGARFRSYVDGRVHDLSPEGSIAMQTAIGSDIMMALDECLDSTLDEGAVRAAMERTHRWALRSLAARVDPAQALFAIVQGGLSPALRAASVDFLTAQPFDGFAIGGLAVGDTRAEREEITVFTAARLPSALPRYLMGVGTPPDLLRAIGFGVDLFDCVLPTHLAWQGTAFTSTGRVRITRGAHRLAEAALDARCACPTCATFSRAYLHHLFKCSEPLGPRLLSVHNLHHYLDLMRQARAAIDAGAYDAFARAQLAAIDRHEHAEARARLA
ncbi:MAG TPA: tRNA guanosine(34) transglycosylase Tgt [Polyangia bacterium]|nr:tRNA guanosine(34) transglycosylase Tgt [Polyangia bacterium]